MLLASFFWADTPSASEVAVKVGVYESAPIVYSRGDNTYGGPSVEILEHIARQEKWVLEFVPCDWAECLERLEKGEIDLQVYIAYSKEREKLFDYNTVPLIRNWGLIYTSPDIQVTSIFDLEGKKVAFMKDGIHTLALLNLTQKFDINIKAIPVNGVEDVLRLVESGQADAGVVNRFSGLMEAGNYKVLRTPVVFNPREIRYASTKGHNRDILAAIDTHLTQLKADHNSIYYRSFEQAIPSQISSVDLRWLWRLLLGVSAVLVTAVGSVVFARYQVRKKTRTLLAATEALRKSEGDFRTIFENMPDVFYRTNETGEIVMISPSCFECFGYTQEELIGRKITDFYKNPEERNAVLSTISNAKGEPITVEADLRRKDGRVVSISTKAFAQLDDRGNVICIEGIARDVTGEKEAYEALHRAQKMNAVGQLTGGIAHDFNNNLGIVMGNLELLQRVIPEDPEISSYIEQAIKGARRSTDITKKLLKFSRKDTHGTKLVSPNASIQGMEEFIAKSLTASIQIELHLADDLWMTMIDPGDLEDAILNLSLNARDAMPDGGTVVIETANKVVDENYARHNPSSKAGEFVMISVSDTGMGMPGEVQDKIFDPFYSTKEEGKGTGLGLSMVYGFVERSGGYIDVYSEPGKGSRFCLYLPRSREEAIKDERMTDIAQIPRGTEKILVVDDEQALTDIAGANLQGLGYTILTANNGETALQILKDNEDIELLFCDIIMPGNLDGYQVALEAHKYRPSLKVLLTSGFMKDRGKYLDEDGEYISRLIANLVDKPYNRSDIAVAVRRALDE